jgi:hypothetical protein
MIKIFCYPYIIIYTPFERGLTFQHILKTLQHIPKTLQHISLFNTFFNQNAKKNYTAHFFKTHKE